MKLDDPDGIYNEYSDPSIIKPIESNSEIGSGKTISVEYDRSKGDKLFYDLYYIQENGKVQTLGGGIFFTENGNVFSQEITIFDSLAVESGRGFIELTTVSDDMKNIKLSMTMVRFTE